MSPNNVKICYVEIPCDGDYTLDALIKTLTDLKDRFGGESIACEKVELKYWREMTPEEVQARDTWNAQIKEIQENYNCSEYQANETLRARTVAKWFADSKQAIEEDISRIAARG